MNAKAQWTIWLLVSALAVTLTFMALDLKKIHDLETRLEAYRFPENAEAPRVQTPEERASANFWSWPMPDTVGSRYFLVLDSIRGTAIQPELANASFHIVYDLQDKRYVGIINTDAALGGRDYVMEIRRDPDGTIAKAPHLHEDAANLLAKFGVVPGSTR